MSMMSFRDAMGAVANKGATASPPPAVPTPAPFLAEMVATVEPALVETYIAPTPTPQAARTPVSGFGAMLHRVAAQSGAPVVSILDEAIATPPAPAANPVDESFLAGIANSLTNAADRLDGLPRSHDALHGDAHTHLSAATDALTKAHAAVSASLEHATDETHKAHLTHTLASLSSSLNQVGAAKQASNLGQHHYAKVSGRIS